MIVHTSHLSTTDPVAGWYLGVVGELQNISCMYVFSELFFYYGIGWLVHWEDCFSHSQCAFVAYISLSRFVTIWAFSFHSMSIGAILIQIMFRESWCFHEYCLFDLPRKYNLAANLPILWFLHWFHYPDLQCSMSPILQELW